MPSGSLPVGRQLHVSGGHSINRRIKTEQVQDTPLVRRLHKDRSVLERSRCAREGLNNNHRRIPNWAAEFSPGLLPDRKGRIVKRLLIILLLIGAALAGGAYWF